MKLIYLTAKSYPATTADHLFVKQMARAFAELLQSDFSLFIAGSIPEELHDCNPISVSAPARFKSAFYFFWIPYFILSSGYNSRETVFFSSDSNLLTLLIMWRRALGLRYRVVSEWHMLFNNRKDGFVMRGSDALITTTSHLKDLIVRSFAIPPGRITVAYGGVDLGDFPKGAKDGEDLRGRLGLPKKAFLVGYIGFFKTMGMEKGLRVMIEALKHLADPQLRMVFVGGRPGEIEAYRRFAAQEGVVERCIFIPAVPSGEVPVWERVMDVLVIPYPDERHFRDYGFPMKAYEYMASGRPIVYSDLPIIREVLNDCAIAFIPGDAADFAAKINAIQHSPSSYNGLVAVARAKVERFSWRERALAIVQAAKALY